MSTRKAPASVPTKRAALSNAERQRKHREKRKAELQALRAGPAAPLSLRLALPLPSALPVAASALPDDSPSLRMQLDAARKRCEVQAAELAALRAEHEPLVARLLALRTVLRAVIGKFSPAARHVARSHLQETGFIEWLDAD
ncbi:hypothetical protein C8C96_1228 [Acidovorax sp. 100]|uniref:hypothetical protein n=1 Tax=Acidovorax sp. 100 TaxID=2135635 RepID=UPI000EF9CC07|nr:hypothetical protein [Acidovorax sp. 100]RMA60208.1 hypothetical protein C8C96_1228 [Acidovorax sp. 100]